MSDNNRIPAVTPKCEDHPDAEVARKRDRGVDFAFCKECTECLGLYCMSDMSGDLCQYLRHTTATHMALDGRTWVDCDLNKADVEVALGDEEVQTELD